MTIRPFFFWAHLAAGVCAGLVILTMSLTGTLLMYERQIIAWADSGYRSTPRDGVSRLPLETIVERVRQDLADVQPTAVTVRAEADAPVAIAAGRRTVYADAYTGSAVGEASRGGVRAAMSTLREWHRWLAMTDEQRPTGKAITGWSTLIFLGIVCSGMYLWLPRRWAWQNVRAVLMFRGGIRGKARDFNWHNVIGIWSAVPLFFVVVTALPISFPWASALIYRAVGETPPPAAQPSAAAEPARIPAVSVDGLDRAFARATQQVDGWRSISVRLPAQRGAYVFTVDRGDGGQPQLRDTLTVNAAGEVVRFEPFAGQTLGRRLRSLSRFTHTGEVLGVFGQTIAGVVSFGAVVLVWTGLALALRRLTAYAGSRTRVAGADLSRSGDYLKLPHSSIPEP